MSRAERLESVYDFINERFEEVAYFASLEYVLGHSKGIATQLPDLEKTLLEAPDGLEFDDALEKFKEAWARVFRRFDGMVNPKPVRPTKPPNIAVRFFPTDMPGIYCTFSCVDNGSTRTKIVRRKDLSNAEIHALTSRPREEWVVASRKTNVDGGQGQEIDPEVLRALTAKNLLPERKLPSIEGEDDDDDDLDELMGAVAAPSQSAATKPSQSTSSGEDDESSGGEALSDDELDDLMS